MMAWLLGLTWQKIIRNSITAVVRGGGGGDRWAGDREKRGRELYGRREKRGLEAGEKGKITRHCAIFCNPKNAKRRVPTNTGREPGLKGTGSGS